MIIFSISSFPSQTKLLFPKNYNVCYLYNLISSNFTNRNDLYICSLVWELCIQSAPFLLQWNKWREKNTNNQRKTDPSQFYSQNNTELYAARFHLQGLAMPTGISFELDQFDPAYRSTYQVCRYAMPCKWKPSFRKGWFSLVVH